LPLYGIPYSGTGGEAGGLDECEADGDKGRNATSDDTVKEELI